MSIHNPFGMMMPGRQLSPEEYRFGFNGKEKDDEVKGTGNQIDYGLRAYDPRFAKFLSIDPLMKLYPRYTPYQIDGNNPIHNVDLDGKEDQNYLVHLLKIILGKGESPSNAEEAQQQANERQAIHNVEEDVRKLAEANNTVYGSFLPGYSALYQYSQKNYSSALLLGSFDFFGGELLSGAGKVVGKAIGPEALNSAGKLITNLLEDATKYYKETFRNGEYAIQEATEDFIVYRISGGKSTAEGGQFFSLTKPSTSDEAEKLLKLKNASGNTATEVTPVTIQKGQQFAIGEVEGGKGSQIFIPTVAQEKVVRHLNKTEILK